MFRAYAPKLRAVSIIHMQADQPEHDSMDGIGGDAALASSLIRDMAMLLGVSSTIVPQSAVHLLQAIDHRLQDIMQGLPEAFLAPLLPEGSLNEQQVTSANTVISGLYHLCVCGSLPGPLGHPP